MPQDVGQCFSLEKHCPTDQDGTPAANVRELQVTAATFGRHDRDHSDIVRMGRAAMVDAGLGRFQGAKRELDAFGVKLDKALQERLRELVATELRQ